MVLKEKKSNFGRPQVSFRHGSGTVPVCQSPKIVSFSLSACKPTSSSSRRTTLYMEGTIARLGGTIRPLAGFRCPKPASPRLANERGIGAQIHLYILNTEPQEGHIGPHPKLFKSLTTRLARGWSWSDKKKIQIIFLPLMVLGNESPKEILIWSARRPLARLGFLVHNLFDFSCVFAKILVNNQ